MAMVAALAWLVLLLGLPLGLPLGCLHDWDSLDPREGDGSALCPQYCEVYGRCAAAVAEDCVAACNDKTAGCSTQARLDLQACVADLDSSCGGNAAVIVFDVCAGLVDCWGE